MKTVYLAFDNDTGTEVAWNQLPLSHLSPRDRKRVDSEIRIARSLDHRHILKFYTAWLDRTSDTVLFITERATGGTLRQYISRLSSPLKLRVVKRWAVQILEGLSYLHSRSPPVLHRDIKCSNLFESDGKILIGDLGLSTQECRAASLVGTPEFMAPELYEEGCAFGCSADVYAFGMCLLELVSREKPYAECGNAVQVFRHAISAQHPAVLDRVKDAGLKELIKRCIHIDPNSRPTAAALKADPYWSSEGSGFAEVEPMGGSLHLARQTTDAPSMEVPLRVPRDENHSVLNPEKLLMKPGRLCSSSSATTTTPSPKFSRGHLPGKPLIESMAKALGIDSETLNIFLAM